MLDQPLQVRLRILPRAPVHVTTQLLDRLPMEMAVHVEELGVRFFIALPL